MKWKPTPLLILSIGCLLTGTYALLFGIGGNLSGLGFIVCATLAVLSFLLYMGSRRLFKSSIGREVIAELMVICCVAFFIYKRTGRIILHVPEDYSGYLIVTYGVAGMPPLPVPGLFHSDVDVAVPGPGILFTSSPRSKDISIAQAGADRPGKVKARHGVPFVQDSLRCGKERYRVDVLFIGKHAPGWTFSADTATRSAIKQAACSLLRR